MSYVNDNSKNVLKHLSSLDEYSQNREVRLIPKIPEDEN
jgi:hypothetical protein